MFTPLDTVKHFIVASSFYTRIEKNDKIVGKFSVVSRNQYVENGRDDTYAVEISILNVWLLYGFDAMLICWRDS